MLAAFSNTNHAYYGYSLAGATHADLFLDAALGSATYLTGSSSSTTLLTGADGTLFKTIMGDAYAPNTNIVWRYRLADNVTAYSSSLNHTTNWISGTSSNTNVTKGVFYSLMTQKPLPKGSAQ
ncbi:hypothetical protein CXF85_21790 [Colwellia sp. 75C3]|uniref:hypothetical protein n=1 Tax=Colwellia sp. 75C3 TaxID=888425 RepID=UPI000C34D249|nr:hypothetical protein [Colwellia sp. 75C3]PKG80748.1 hypothetical protein CXF85_21790 [Colwellia sp. 75C3]